MAFTENLGAFFLDFAEDITLAGTEGVGIFDASYISQLDAIASVSPAVTIWQADFPTSLVGAAGVVRGVNYLIVGVEPDGTGIAVVRLEKV
jgi:hypothetical protein